MFTYVNPEHGTSHLYKQKTMLSLLNKKIILPTFFSIASIHASISHNTEHHQIINHARGMYGQYPITRDASGTSWQPDATKMPMIHITNDKWAYMIQGYANIIWDHQRGPRGGTKFFSENMLMATAQRNLPYNTCGLRGMISLEPGTIGAKGYPLLLQTGETADGKIPLIDRQHPHDLFMELATTWNFLIRDDSAFFFYFGLPGEPALGPPVYIMRFSSLYNPETPITHHWLDSTHITFGVLTAGYTWKWLKIDSSIFTGKEPDQHRWSFNRPRFDSQSIRFSINPTDNLAFQISYAALTAPEQLEPCVNIQRFTASASYHHLWNNNQWQTTAAWGKNMSKQKPDLDGILLESTLEIHKKYIFFARAEYVAKQELFLPPDPRAQQIFRVGKLNGGALYVLHHWNNIQFDIGLCSSVILVPHTLKSTYDGNKFSYMIFMRFELQT